MAIERKEIKLNITSSDLQLSQEGKYTPSRIISRRYVLKGFGAVVASVMMWNTASAESEEADELNAECNFLLGFKTIRDMIPDKVGDCLENEHHNPENGDALQRTTGGLLVWRKSDNWTAFTDGYRTWVNGPNGLQERLNTERFPWENDPIQDNQEEDIDHRIKEIMATLPPTPAPPEIVPGPNEQKRIQSILDIGIHDNYREFPTGHKVRDVFGRFIKATLDREKGMVKVYIEAGQPAISEIELYPSAAYPLWIEAMRGRTAIKVLETPDPEVALAAFYAYYKKGDPVSIARDMAGKILGPRWQEGIGYNQRATTWR